MPRKDIASYSVKKHYKLHSGTWAWLLHRISGVIIGLFLIFHLLVVNGGALSETVIAALVRSNACKAVVALLFALHAINGLRIISMEFFSSADRKKNAPHLAVALVVVLAVGVFLAYKILA